MFGRSKPEPGKGPTFFSGRKASHAFEPQPLSAYRNLVFRGGSVKGIAYCGSFAALEAVGVDLKAVQRVAGTSAGSITAMVLAVGMSPKEAKTLVADTDFAHFMDKDSPVKSGPMLRLLGAAPYKGPASTKGSAKASDGSSVASMALGPLKDGFGVYSGQALLDYFEAAQFSKTKINACTFGELKGLHENNPKRYKLLYVTTYDLNTQTELVLSHETYPDMPIAHACRASAAIPFFFQPHYETKKVIQPNGGIAVVKVSDHAWVDGGMADNYPLHVFDTTAYRSAEVHGEPTEGKAPESKTPEALFNWESLGFFLTTKRKAEAFRGARAPEAAPIDKLMPFAKAALAALQNQQSATHYLSLDAKRTLYVDHGEVSTFDFCLTAAQKAMLIKNGWEAVCRGFGKPDLPMPAWLKATSADTPEVAPEVPKRMISKIG